MEAYPQRYVGNNGMWQERARYGVSAAESRDSAANKLTLRKNFLDVVVNGLLHDFERLV